MTTDTKKVAGTDSKSEKVSALTSLIGPEVVDRLRKRHPGLFSSVEPPEPADLGRVDWQKNRLLEKLRSGWAKPQKGLRLEHEDSFESPEGQCAEEGVVTGSKIDSCIAAGLSLTDLRHEHPAVIARVLRSLDRGARVSVLQQLPGKTARAALRRLKSS